jgi:tRNA threonylcarbamoyl adenosine modification protein (Sua5/YciO/YrdC/YwlC family)
VSSLFDCTDSTLATDAVHQSIAALDRGEIVVVPTDTVYGVAVSPKIPGAIDRVVVLKGRERTAPPPFLVGGVEQVWPLVAEGSHTDDVAALIHGFWPGGLTMVLPVNPELEWDIGETSGTIAVRMPNEPVLLELLRSYGPLAVTSANLTGDPPCESASAALNIFGDRAGVYLDAGLRGSADGEQIPSTIIDVTDLASGGNTIRVIRPGAISVDQLAEVLPDAVIQ